MSQGRKFALAAGLLALGLAWAVLFRKSPTEQTATPEPSTQLRPSPRGPQSPPRSFTQGRGARDHAPSGFGETPIPLVRLRGDVEVEPDPPAGDDGLNETPAHPVAARSDAPAPRPLSPGASPDENEAGPPPGDPFAQVDSPAPTPDDAGRRLAGDEKIGAGATDGKSAWQGWRPRARPEKGAAGPHASGQPPGQRAPRPGAPPAAPNSTSSRAAPEKERKFRRHVLQDGDTLAQLADRYLGAGGRFLEIYEANRTVLTSPDLLPVGATIRIPIDDSVESKPAGAASRNGQSRDEKGLVPVNKPGRHGGQATGKRTYRVKAGDSLEGIAEQFYGDASRWPELLDANRARLNGEDDLQAGMVLTVP